ncbi:MAG: type 4a pilus biogenesis protein PilO [Phycisphaeraceae bacterium]
MRLGLRELLFILLVAAVPVAAWMLVFQPWGTQIAQAKTEIGQKQEKLEELELATQNIDDLGKEIDKLSGALDTYEAKLPARQELDKILKEVWELAAKHQLEQKGVEPDKIVTRAQYAELPIKMKIVGDFDGFYSFMLDLERLPRVTRMPTMDLVRDHEQDGQMEAIVTLSIFFDGGRAKAGQETP